MQTDTDTDTVRGTKFLIIMRTAVALSLKSLNNNFDIQPDVAG